MTVADLIDALKGCDPKAVVLIPATSTMGQGSEPVADVTIVDAARLSASPGSTSGAVRLTGFALMLGLETGA